MSISSEITRLQNAKADIKSSIEEKGVTVPSTATLNEYSELIDSIPTGGGDIDWSAIGFDGIPQAIQDGYDYAIEVKNNWNSSETSLSYKFSNNLNLMFMPLVSTSLVTNMGYMFNNCYSLISIPLLNTSKVTNMEFMCSSCENLKSFPLLDTSSVTSMYNIFQTCRSLHTIPLLDTSSVTNMQDMFNTCLSLTDNSLDNILQMCVNATSYTGTKTLSYLGIRSYYGYPVSRIQALPHYQDFLDAGWTIGY